MAKKSLPPFMKNPLEKKEEKVKKDLDNDGEKGEPLTHQKKVLGAGPKVGAKVGAPMKGKIAPPFVKGSGKKK